MPINTKISDIMTKDIFYVNIDDTIKQADELMKEEHIKQVPVLDNGKLIGVITERSIMEYTLKKLYDDDDPYGEDGYNKILEYEKILTKNYHTIYPEDSVQKAVEIISKKKADFLPVVDWENNLVGVVTVHDIILFFHKKFVEGTL